MLWRILDNCIPMVLIYVVANNNNNNNYMCMYLSALPHSFQSGFEGHY